MKKMLVVYYSWSCGNTERIAKKLSDTTGADIERIETVKPYTGSYDDVVNQGQQEVNSGYCPEIKPLKADLSKYDVIALGTPTWWYTMAPAMLTFIKNTSFEGKTVIPFATSANDDIGESGKLLEEMAGTGNWLEGERFSSSVSKDAVTEWIEGLNL